MTNLVRVMNTVQDRILNIRDKKVLLDRDLAALYGVPTKALNQAVTRNKDRFPEDFMFRLSREEAATLLSDKGGANSRSQFVTLKQGHNLKYLPYVFTEHGILMLSSVLNSRQAIQVNIQIMRVFMKLRELTMTNKDLMIRIDEIEKRYDKQFQIVFKAIKLLLENDSDKGKEGGKRFEF